MAEHDMTKVRLKLEALAEGPDGYDGSRKDAHAELVACQDAVAAFAKEHAVKLDLPHVGDRPDWRRIPDKASALLLLLDALEDPAPGAPGVGSEAAQQAASAAGDGEGDSDTETIETAVYDRIAAGGGATMQQLCEVADASERDIRAAIKLLREKHQSDSPDHVVNWSGKYWLARELSAMGKDLQHTARGTLKVAGGVRMGDADEGKRRGGAEPKPAYKGKSKKNLMEEVHELLEGHPDAEKVMLEVVSRIDEHFAARQHYKDVLAECRDLQKQADHNLKDAAEQEHDGNDTARLAKLHEIEMSWQAREEKYAEAVELRKEARERKKTAENRLAGLMNNLRQLELPI